MRSSRCRTRRNSIVPLGDWLGALEDSSSPPGRPRSPGSGYISGSSSSEPGAGDAAAGSVGRRPAGAAARRGAAGHRAGAEERLEDLQRAELVASPPARAPDGRRRCGRSRAPARRSAGWAARCACSRPVLMKMRWPPATKALSVPSWTIMISTALGIEAGRPPDRRDEGADRVLDLGVADQTEPLTLLRNGGTKRREREQHGTEEGEDASGSRAARANRQAMNARPRRQLRKLALVGAVLAVGLWRK